MTVLANPATTADRYYNAYAFTVGQLDDLQSNLIGLLRASYFQAIASELIAGGCTPAFTQPDTEARLWIERIARQKAGQIANTHNKRLRRQIDGLLALNADRQAIIRTLDAWKMNYINERFRIIRNDVNTTAGNYAVKRFYEENEGAKLYRWFAVPILLDNSHEKCRQRVTAYPNGAPKEIADQWAADIPHPNCRHKLQPVGRKRLDCNNVWRG